MNVVLKVIAKQNLTVSYYFRIVHRVANFVQVKIDAIIDQLMDLVH